MAKKKKYGTRADYELARAQKKLMQLRRVLKGLPKIMEKIGKKIMKEEKLKKKKPHRK
jgi:hypothetical protein